MNKRIILYISIITIILAGLIGAGVRTTQAQDPTIPTRTPTPDPNQPTRSNPTASPGNPENPPPPGSTSTSESGVSASPTGTVAPPGSGLPLISQTPATLTSIAPSEVGAPSECDDTPYVQATKRLTIYGGPGGDYAVVGTLDIDEKRLILGRAGFADWWQIQVSPDTIGWVDNEDVSVLGNPTLVLVVEAPAIRGAAPTPGFPWNPTPLSMPACPHTPTPSPTATTSPASTPLATGGAEGAGTAGGESTSATPAMVVAEIASATAAPVATETEPGLGVSSRGSEASRAASPTSVTNLVLPLAGLALIAGGIALALLSRNRGNGKTDEPKTDEPK